MSDPVIVKCKSCGQKNRVPPVEQRWDKPVQCGKCHLQFTASEILDAKRKAIGAKDASDKFVDDMLKTARDMGFGL